MHSKLHASQDGGHAPPFLVFSRVAFMLTARAGLILDIKRKLVIIIMRGEQSKDSIAA